MRNIFFAVFIICFFPFGCKPRKEGAVKSDASQSASVEEIPEFYTDMILNENIEMIESLEDTGASGLRLADQPSSSKIDQTRKIFGGRDLASRKKQCEQRNINEVDDKCREHAPGKGAKFDVDKLFNCVDERYQHCNAFDNRDEVGACKCKVINFLDKEVIAVLEKPDDGREVKVQSCYAQTTSYSKPVFPGRDGDPKIKEYLHAQISNVLFRSPITESLAEEYACKNVLRISDSYTNEELINNLGIQTATYESMTVEELNAMKDNLGHDFSSHQAKMSIDSYNGGPNGLPRDSEFPRMMNFFMHHVAKQYASADSKMTKDLLSKIMSNGVGRAVYQESVRCRCELSTFPPLTEYKEAFARAHSKIRERVAPEFAKNIWKTGDLIGSFAWWPVLDFGAPVELGGRMKTPFSLSKLTSLNDLETHCKNVEGEMDLYSSNDIAVKSQFKKIISKGELRAATLEEVISMKKSFKRFVKEHTDNLLYPDLKYMEAIAHVIADANDSCEYSGIPKHAWRSWPAGKKCLVNLNEEGNRGVDAWDKYAKTVNFGGFCVLRASSKY